MDSRAFQLNRLTDEQRENPEEIFSKFFDHFTLQDVRKIFEELTYLAVSDKTEQNLETTISDMVFAMARLEELAEAAYLVYGKKSK